MKRKKTKTKKVETDCESLALTLAESTCSIESKAEKKDGGDAVINKMIEDVLKEKVKKLENKVKSFSTKATRSTRSEIKKAIKLLDVENDEENKQLMKKIKLDKEQQATKLVDQYRTKKEALEKKRKTMDSLYMQLETLEQILEHRMSEFEADFNAETVEYLNTTRAKNLVIEDQINLTLMQG